MALIDLYADGHVGIQMGACALPPVDCSLSFMMLMVQMADRCGEIPSHLDRYKEEVDGLLFQLYGDEPCEYNYSFSLSNIPLHLSQVDKSSLRC